MGRVYGYFLNFNVKRVYEKIHDTNQNRQLFVLRSMFRDKHYIHIILKYVSVS